MIGDSTVYSPPLLAELQHDSNVLYYRIDAVEMPCFMTISDGDAGISAGLGGAFPSMDHQHIECWL